MTTDTWLRDIIDESSISTSETSANCLRLEKAFNACFDTKPNQENLQHVFTILEFQVFDLLANEEQTDSLREVAAQAFQLGRVLPIPEDSLDADEWIIRLGCLSVLGNRSADFKRISRDYKFPSTLVEKSDWGRRVWVGVLDIWFCLLRKGGWDDLDNVQQRVAEMRELQRSFEPDFLKAAEARQDTRPAWELMNCYHLAKAAEDLGKYISQGSVDGRFDIRQQLQSQFDRAIITSERGGLREREVMSRLLARTANILVANSIWTVTRAVNSKVTEFVRSLASRKGDGLMLEMLPPQRRVLREHGLLGSGDRSVVINLPTSSGKTLIAQFRMLQALNQFDIEKGWIAYLAPTRALVGQLTIRLRRDFASIGVNVEKVSPALEIDGLEAEMLADQDDKGGNLFRVLVTTPEKLDLMLRGGWEAKINRPLTLVVVDEAHTLATEQRGLKLELLLTTINRECRNAQFLLLTPFINNGDDIARWLAPDSHKSIDIGIEWTPNERVVAISRAEKGEGRGDYNISLSTHHTSRKTINVPEKFNIGSSRPLGLAWSKVHKSPGKIAAATAQALHARGTVIVLARGPAHAWRVAELLTTVEENKVSEVSDDLVHIKNFLIDEMGRDFPLANLLEYGVAVHHAGLSDDTKAIVEWLTEKQMLRVLVATTTIAQGVNFPVSGVVFASHQYPKGKEKGSSPWQDMPAADFWNIAGRAGRVDQGDLGVIALVADSDKKAADIKKFLDASVGELNSTLIGMVSKAMASGHGLKLDELAYDASWSAFVQYLAHTYRMIGNHEQFVAEVELVLRGTLGFQELRKSHKGWDQALVEGVSNYAKKLEGKSLKLVDLTGFSWESVSHTLMRLKENKISDDVWTPELFSGGGRKDLRRMMGVLLAVPELRQNLEDVTGGEGPDGNKLARIICDWVQGSPLNEMATKYFKDTSSKNNESAITNCCRSIFGRLTQTASWGLSALQSLTIKDFEGKSEDEQRMLRNLPSWVYYGVNTDEAVALRLLGVPRKAATPLAEELDVRVDDSLYQVRKKLIDADKSKWSSAMGDIGESYHRVWSIIEGR